MKKQTRLHRVRKSKERGRQTKQGARKHKPTTQTTSWISASNNHGDKDRSSLLF